MSFTDSFGYLDSASLPDMITAVSFTPDGKTCIAGTLGGLCMFFDIDGLKYVVSRPYSLTCAANPACRLDFSHRSM